MIVIIALLAACSPTKISNRSPTSNPITPSFPTKTEPIPPTPTTPFTLTPIDTQTPVAVPPEICTTAGLPDTACKGVLENQQWEPVSREFNQVNMVLVPVGCFWMGNDSGFEEEQPAHQICFQQPFWIDSTEVTVSQFASFLNGQPEPVESYEGWLMPWGTTSDLIHIQLIQEGSTWYPMPGEDQRPLEHTTWIGANDYCQWREARLPTEAEWEYAARGPESYLYPWGNELIRENIVIYKGRNPEVGSIPEGASWVGALDMIGSVFEWTSSLYQPYPYNPSDGREMTLTEDSEGNRVFRGSPWYHSDQQFDLVSTPARFEAPPDFANWYHGFRCARSID